MRWFSFIIVLLAFVVGACDHSPRASGSFPQDIYVWQRAWTSSVRTALKESRDDVNSFVVLTAEISLTHDEPRIVRPEIDYAALRESGKALGVAIRINPYSGPFLPDDAATKSIVRLASERIAEARRNGIEPVELQIDFDCADSKLSGYGIWLQALREAVAPLPVRPTVLPSWLSRAGFGALARESGGFILQVHSVAPPRRPEEAGKLTDPARAIKWVEEAARHGVPFRVALPTYTYLVAFDDQNRIRGISAEGPSARWPVDSRVLRWEADPAEMAELITQWSKERPACMTGVIWYRLPIATDSLNWRWATLAQVMRGTAPRSKLRLETSNSQPSEVILINSGERDESFPGLINAHWTGAKLVAADALGEYELQSSPSLGDASLQFHRKTSASLSRLPPGARRNIGWIRCDTPTQIRVSVGETVVSSISGDAGSGASVSPGDGL